MHAHPLCRSSTAGTTSFELKTSWVIQGWNLGFDQQSTLFRSRDAFNLLQSTIKKKDLASGKRLQVLLESHGLDCDAYWGDHLIRMFASFEELHEADRAFFKVKNPNVHTWNATISAHAKLKQSGRAVQLFFKMLQTGTGPNKLTFLYALKACKNLGSVRQIMLLHDRILRSDFHLDNIIVNVIVDVYAKCGNLAEARRVFDVMSCRDAVSWCSMITGYAAHGKGTGALELFNKMQEEGLTVDKITFTSVLKACGTIQAAQPGRIIHDQVIKNGLELDLFIGSSLVDMYAKGGCLLEAHKVFEKVQNRNAVSYATLIAGYAEHGDDHHSMELLEEMQHACNDIDKVAFLSIIKACSSVRAYRQGRLIHNRLVGSDFIPDGVLENGLVDMYARCGSVEDASYVFKKLSDRDVVSWGAMISGYSASGHTLTALTLFDQMQQAGVQANIPVFLPVLNACAGSRTLEHGMLIHEQLIKQNFESDLVIGNKLVDMYAKRGCVAEAENVFRGMRYRDVVSWGTLILGCVEHGHAPAALDFFQEMWKECSQADKVMYLCALKACGSTGALKLAKLVHFQVVANSLEQDIEIGNTLIDVYAKVGTLNDAHRAFDQLHTQDRVSWAAIISGHARCGHFHVAGQCLKDMQRQGLQPHDEIFTSLLLACTHAGVIEEGYHFFQSMMKDHGMTPNIEHYNSIIDLLGRVGLLKEAISLLTTMPSSSDLIVWTSLLSSCKTYRSVDLGQQCFNEVLKKDPDDASAYVLMSKIYADAGMWEEIEKIRAIRKCAGAQKKRGTAWLEVNNKVHEFVVGEQFPSMRDPLVCKSQWLNKLIRRSVHLPLLDLVVESASDE